MGTKAQSKFIKIQYAQCPECGQQHRLTEIRGVRQVARHTLYTGTLVAREVCKGSNKAKWIDPIEYRVEEYITLPEFDY